MKFIFTLVSVTVLVGAATGSSAANPLIASANGPQRIIAMFPTGVAAGTGFGLIDTITLNADGSVTVTTRAVVATQNLVVTVTVATPSNS